MTPDRTQGLTIIAFVGSVFSPYYASSGRQDPGHHCALNVALYGRGGRWAMTERGRGDVSRERHHLHIGPSSVRWTGSQLIFDICERSAPFPAKVVGKVTVSPAMVTDARFLIDDDGRHAWWPIAPRAHVEADFSHPDARWAGSGYLDMNAGDEPLEDGFSNWDWLRADVGDSSAVLYDLHRRNQQRLTLGLMFDKTGTSTEMELPPCQRLPRSPIWQIRRNTLAPAGGASIHQTLEDTPFYARSMVDTLIEGRRTIGVHESLDLDRFASPWVKALLPFRMPRWATHGEFSQ